MSQLCSITASPEPISFDPATTALVVIDMQNDFGSHGGMFDLAGLDIAPIKTLVPRISEVLNAARFAGLLVVYTRQEHDADLNDFGKSDAPHRIKHSRMQVGKSITAPDGAPSRILIRDTWNTAIVPELAPQPGDVVISKHRYSAFFETQLELGAQDPRDRHAHLHGRDNEHLCGFHSPRRYFPRLSVHRPTRLYARADWAWSATQQPRGNAAGH